MKNKMASEHFISIDQLSIDRIDRVLNRAEEYVRSGIPEGALRGKIIASLFFEPSTRTRLSFEAAVHRLGGRVIGVLGAESTSLAKGESLEDTIRMVDSYADMIVMRHPDMFSAKRAADVAVHSVINAGDGANEHPTQTLLDLFTIKHSQGSLNGKKIAFVGDLKYGRVPHSTARSLALFPDTVQYWVSPQQLCMPEEVKKDVVAKGVQIIETEDLVSVIPQVDILIMTRVQKERFANEAEYESVKNIYTLTPEMCAQAQPHMKIMHPLPRLTEIPSSIDPTPYAYYFEQASFGVPVRAALLSLIVEGEW